MELAELMVDWGEGGVDEWWMEYQLVMLLIKRRDIIIFYFLNDVLERLFQKKGEDGPKGFQEA